MFALCAYNVSTRKCRDIILKCNTSLKQKVAIIFKFGRRSGHFDRSPRPVILSLARIVIGVRSVMKNALAPMFELIAHMDTHSGLTPPDIAHVFAAFTPHAPLPPRS